MRKLLQHTSPLSFTLMISGCGLALNLDDYDIVDDGISGDGDVTSSGDGDGDARGSGGSDSTGSGGASDAASGGMENWAGSDGVDGSGGAEANTGGDTGSGGSDPEEECEDDQVGSAVDSGCTNSAPFCSSGACVQCLADSDCRDDGHTCSVESCSSGTCQRDYDDSACPTHGDPCLDTTCTQDGCEALDNSREIDLLEGDGSFETTANWVITGDASLVEPNVGSAYEGSQVARFTFAQNDLGNVYQILTVPPGTQSLTIEGYYRSYGAGDDHGNDYLRVGYWDDGAGAWYGLALDTQDNAESAEVNEWTAFENSIDYGDLIFLDDEDHTIEFDLLGSTNSGFNIRHFAADDVRVFARVCGPSSQ